MTATTYNDGRPRIGAMTKPASPDGTSVRKRIVWPLLAALVIAAGAVAVVPRGLDAGWLLVAQDDPVKLADRMVARTFSAPVAEREIAAALDAGDIDLADSFVDLAGDQGIALPPELKAKVAAAHTTTASATRNAGSFARGLITGEPDDMVGLAGTALGDLFVFGDIRDAVREGARFAQGEKADELVLGLACVGMAVTVGTYASLGTGTPARVGLSLVKAARKTGRISAHMAGWMTRSMREVVDTGKLQRALAEASLTAPAVAVRAARDAVKLDKAEALVDTVRDVGRVQAKAGTQAALDGLKVSEGPRDMKRLAALAEAKGTRTRAILRLAGRAALVVTGALFDLAGLLFSAVFMLFGFCSAVKSTTERTTQRYLNWRKRRRRRQWLEAMAQA
jgi:hypothetical protein